MTIQSAVHDRGRDRRRSAERRGRLAEVVAVVALWLRGYRILARRWRSSAGEIDIVALRRNRLAFVEVKYRAERDNAETSVGRRQMRRLHAAGAAFVARHPAYRTCERGFDAVFLAAGVAPVYARDHLQPTVSRF